MNNHELDVYLNQTLTGQLSIDTQGDMTFVYEESYRTQENNLPLSRSLPLQMKPMLLVLVLQFLYLFLLAHLLSEYQVKP